MMSSIILFLSCIRYVVSNWVPPMENSNLFQGDMVLDPDERGGANAFASIKGGRWPNNIVPYDISRMSIANHPKILKGLEEYHKHTCLRFVNRTNEDTYISFYPGSGCSSPVGYRHGRINDISLADGCLQLGTVLHEIGHSIGLFHEQSRPDRDNFVTINWSFIQPSMRFNFIKTMPSSIDSLGFPYDYESMMHYGETAFGGGRITITTTDPSKQKVIGGRFGFSIIDIKQINAMYKCEVDN